MGRTYSVETAEPLYSGSEEIVIKGATLKAAVSAWFAAQRRYRGDPENNPSYAEIKEEREITVADENVVYGRQFDISGGPQIWEVWRDLNLQKGDRK